MRPYRIAVLLACAASLVACRTTPRTAAPEPVRGSETVDEDWPWAHLDDGDGFGTFID